MKFTLYKTLILFIFVLITSCNLNNPDAIQVESEENDEVLAMVSFKVSLPTPLPPGETLYLVELDEVTSLSFNQVQHTMEADNSLSFHLDLPVSLGSVLKYKYVRQGEYNQQEYTLSGKPVRYRIVQVKEPITIHDIVGRWIDSDISLPKGRLNGKVVDSTTGQPLPNILISASGMLSWTSSEGIFQIQDIPEGTHNVVAYAPDGSYAIFQQEAFIAENSATQAFIQLEKVPFIKVTFIVDTPLDTPAEAVVRLAGNLYQMGNAFADLRGGINHTAVRLPALTQTATNQFRITMDLPAGWDIRYKYTLGDGIWNAEHEPTGNFITRQNILPNHDIEVHDRVVTWRDSSAIPVIFSVDVPSITPVNEIISIQFNPGYTWLEPIPLWQTGANRWQIKLYSPLSGIKTMQYRYCRDVQCGSADDSISSGNLNTGRALNMINPPENRVDTIEKWAWYDGPPPSAVVPNLQIEPRQDDFIAGVELQEGNHPSWFLRFPSTLKDLIEINANWVISHPSWTFINNAPPLQGLLPGNDILTTELVGMLNYSHSQSLKAAIFPISNYPKSPDLWWMEAVRDFPWWVSWFDRYQEFINHYAIIAEQTGTEALILGDPNIKPALPKGNLANGDPSNAPEDIAQRWRSLIANAKDNFHGQIWWVTEVPFDIQNFLEFSDLLDGYYILWDEPLTKDPGADLDTLVAEAGNILDEKILPLKEKFGKTIILAVSYPSATGGVTGCLPGLEGGCLDVNLLNQPNPDIPNISLDLHDQENAYNAVFLAAKERTWISGIVSRGFYPPVPLQDKSQSVHGKPASGVLWFWFAKLTGK